MFPIGLGANAVGGHNLYPNLDEAKGKALVRDGIKNGVDFIDTAFIYGEGRSEELIGEVLQEFKREDVIIATKAAHRKKTAMSTFSITRQPFLKRQSMMR